MLMVMNAPAETITVTLPRSVFRELPLMTADLLDRMHELLERNTDGSLSAMERSELETLVHMAQFAQILEMAVCSTGKS